MANENFGLGYTVSSTALWNDDFEGAVGEFGTIFIPFIVDEPSQGEFGTIYVPFAQGGPSQGEFGTIYIPLDGQGPALAEAGTLDTTGLCGLNILSLPGQSALSGPPLNIISCP